jgi:4-amino-4-deoxy-L-arabinose transferase-like glycosyltransferase
LKSDSQSKTARALAALFRLGKCVQDFIERRERTTFWLTLAVFVVFAFYRACVTPLWFDELFTLFIARLSSLETFLRAMPVDNQPPLGDLLTHAALRLFGDGALAVRLPELLAYAAAGWVTYRIVRLRGTAVQALFAMALLLGANVNKIQAITARPYELMLLMTALVFTCWQWAAEREGGRFLPIFGLALGVAGAVLTHHFAIIQVGVLLGAGEAARLWARRRVDWAILCAIALGMLPLTWTMEIMRQSRMLLGEPILHSAIFWARPGVASLKSYQVMVALPLLCLTAAFSTVWILAARREAQRPATSSEAISENSAGAKAPQNPTAVSAQLKSCPVRKHEWAAACALA